MGTSRRLGLVTVAVAVVVLFASPVVSLSAVAGAAGELGTMVSFASEQAPPEPPESGIVNVTIEDASGSQVDDRTVDLTVTNATSGTVVRTTHTGEGWYPVVVRPGDYEVTASAAGYADGSATVTATGGRVVGVTVVLGDGSTPTATPTPTASPSPTPTPTPTATPTPTPTPIDEAIDEDDDGYVGDFEVLDAIEYWRDDEVVPGTNGETIDDFEVLDLIEMWRDDTPV